MVFPVVMYGCESWTIKKAERWGIDAFELWCWRRLLRVPWTARRSNQSILEEISPGVHWKDWCWSWNSQYFGHLMRRAGKDSDAGKDRGQEEKGMTEDEMVEWHWTWWTRVWVNSGSWWWILRPGMLWFMGSERVGHDWATELNWWNLILIPLKRH